MSTALEEPASKSPLSLSTGCLWYITVASNELTPVDKLDPVTTKVTSLPDTVVSHGLDIISVEAEINLNALAPFASMLSDPAKVTDTVLKSVTVKSSSYPILALVAEPVVVLLKALDEELIE